MKHSRSTNSDLQTRQILPATKYPPQIGHARKRFFRASTVSTNCPITELWPPRKRVHPVFFPPSLEQGLLDKLQQYGTLDTSPLKVTSAELTLLSNTKELAKTRNELMHRTLVELNDLGRYAKAALSTLLVFEQRCHDVEFPEVESSYTLDAEVASLMSWLTGEKEAYFRQATAYG